MICAIPQVTSYNNQVKKGVELACLMNVEIAILKYRCRYTKSFLCSFALSFCDYPSK
jgi:hypothetical protein